MVRFLLLFAFSTAAIAHPGHSERGLITSFIDHLVSDLPSLIAAILCVAAALFFALKKRKAKK